jgi:DNA-binding transcriptional ArsR family regulator
MIRIWLAPQDVARTRIAPAPLPLCEVFLSLAAGGGGPARAARSGRCAAPAIHRTLQTTAARHFPKFLAPLPTGRGLDDGLAKLLAAPAFQERRDSGPTTPTVGPVPPRPGPTARHTLMTAVRAYHDRYLAGDLAAASGLVRADVAHRARALATGGVDALLGGLHPQAHWSYPVLTVRSDLDLDLRPEGTGLLLVPSVVATELWIGTRSDALLVLYPVQRADAPPVPAAGRVEDVGPGTRPVDRQRCQPRPAAEARGRLEAAGPADDPLVALLGRSRAAVLRAARQGASTTDLARRAGISAPSASQHATVLRDAGLLVTIRQGKAAHHTLTPLACALLTAEANRC